MTKVLDNTDAGSSLPDGEARERITASLDETLFVEAGAGSGKTSSLVDRIVNLVVAGGVPVGRIAAITFTEAAARELRTRVRDAMIDRGAKGAGDVESAAFTTLHGFALRLLSDHAIEAGLPPGFGVVDEITSALDFERAWRLFTGRIGDDLSLLDLQERAAALDVKLSGFSSVAKSFDDNWDLLERFDQLAGGILTPLSELDFGDLLHRLLALGRLNRLCISDEDLLAAGIDSLVASVEALTWEEPLLVVQGLKSLNWPPRRRGRKDSWRSPGIDHVRAEIESLRTEVDEFLDRLRAEVIGQLTVLVAKHVLDRVADRQRSGQLSFHDLLVLARRLLRSNETVRQGLHQRYTRILLDEFQDTDPIQIELAVLLAHPGPVTGRGWQDLAAELPAGRLVVVGDPKQAIYRFRRADIGVYAQTERVLVDEATKLVANFRSVPGVVEWVNEVFGQAIGEGVEEVQPPYTPLTAVRPAHPQGQVPVTVLGGPHDRGVGIGEIRELEAADVAAIVCHIMADDWPVQVEGSGGPQRSEQ
ncbi:MAG: UvrD-helicase domain-containing protein, partial [Acidimicrobiia bacterium]|nr:UvrD-helicase domain-containing protein [Acidimicrobiia bacterium]